MKKILLFIFLSLSILACNSIVIVNQPLNNIVPMLFNSRTQTWESKTDAIVPVGKSLDLRLDILTKSGKRFTLPVQWELKGDKIGEINENGIFKAIQKGNTVVTGSINNIIKTYMINIIDVKAEALAEPSSLPIPSPGKTPSSGNSSIPDAGLGISPYPSSTATPTPSCSLSIRTILPDYICRNSEVRILGGTFSLNTIVQVNENPVAFIRHSDSDISFEVREEGLKTIKVTDCGITVSKVISVETCESQPEPSASFTNNLTIIPGGPYIGVPVGEDWL